jgi:short-subunit dehydrogenase
MSQIHAKNALITGGASGIGKGMGLQLLKKGLHTLVIWDINENLMQSTAQEFTEAGYRVKIYKVDVMNTNEVIQTAEKVKQEVGKIDILINNAGISMRALVSEVSIQTLQNVMDINFWGTVYCTKAALPSIQQNKGVIVGVSSIAGYRGLPGRSGYSASKFALNGWLEALKTELYASGTHVMWVCPGFTTSNIRNAALDKNAKAQGESPMDEGAMMSSEQCAMHIIQAIEKRKRSLVLTFTGKRTVFMNKYFPAWADKLVHHFFFKDGVLVK